MNFRKFLYDRLLEDTERNADSLQIFGTCGHVNIDGLQSGIVDDVVLDKGGGTSRKGIIK